MDRDSNVPVVDTNTLFQAGSISKPVAAYGALKLVAQRKIALDSNINMYLKSWKLPDNEFTKTKKGNLETFAESYGRYYGAWIFSGIALICRCRPWSRFWMACHLLILRRCA